MAQAGGIPAGYVEITVTIDEDGNCKRGITGHGEGTTCETGEDAQLMIDLFDTELPGFGGGLQIEDAGKTAEYYAEKQKQRASPVNPTKETDKPMFEEPEYTKKELDVGGFGV